MSAPMKITAIAPWIRPLVVQLLRCAADLHERGGHCFTLDDAATALFGEEEHNAGRLHPAFDLACAAISDLDPGPCSTEQLVEAALLVEEGAWP